MDGVQNSESNVCPNCGYCPHCKMSKQTLYPVPYYGLSTYPTYYYPGVLGVTYSVTYSTDSNAGTANS